MEDSISKLRLNNKIDESLLANLKIKKDVDTDTHIYNLDEWATINKVRFNETLHMKFLKIWSILQLPIINLNRGFCEWRIRGLENDVYFITSSKEDSGKSLLERTNWIIQSNTNDKNKILKFLNYFGEATKCYDTYYKNIEFGDYTSELPIVQNVLNDLKKEFDSNFSILNKKF